LRRPARPAPGQRSAQAWRHRHRRANYQQLADLGYSEAQVGLADIQVDSRDPAQIKQAEATYRAAATFRRAPRPASVACWWPSPVPPKPSTTKPKAC
jgi:hypothetical protein